ncbi:MULTISPECIES: DUF6896 domain-containing protein [Pseudomonas]|jgi:hypothetical protein|uniref:DUF6896 domain-containing protein n=1 Tax=Pseudomonas TaxID=286 RepID=UPI001A184C50|nr:MULTISPECIES: hypothetical protein [Pseudomonas]MBJ7372066.1 hypothetical protein [Pseudomonas sp.]MCW0920720.1 hypothetical protein [Pseudomonas sp. RG1]
MNDYNDTTLEDLIKDFLSKVQKGTTLLQEKFGTRNILRLWRSGQIERCGEVNDGVEYELHGIGCAIHFPNESVDFDYGSNNRIDGFDEWRLYMYATDRPLKYKKYTDMKFLESEFKTYIDAGRIEKMSPSDDLYVFIDSTEND